MKTKFFIDFDGTVFETKNFKEELFKLFEKNGFSQDEVLQGYKAECMDYKFSLESWMDRLTKIREYDIENAHKKINTLFDGISKLVFDDFVPFMHNIDRAKYEIDLLTLGDFGFQSRKVENSGVIKYFDNVYYTEEQKWDSLKKFVDIDEVFVLIDDRSDTIHEVGKIYKNAILLEMNRRHPDCDDPVLCKKDYDNTEIRSFAEVFDYLKD